MKQRQMVVWEVLLGDRADAAPGARSLVYAMPIRGRVFIEQAGRSCARRLEAAAIKAGLELGLVEPVMKACIRASTPVDPDSESVFRELAGDDGRTP